MRTGHARHIPFSVPAHAQRLTKDSHNTGNFIPCSFRIVCGFFNVPQWTYINMEGMCETGPTVYRPYPKRLESLTICWFNYKGSTFYSVILRPWVLVRPESNSRPPTWQADAQLTETPVMITLREERARFRLSITVVIIHHTHYEKCDWSRAFNQFTIAQLTW